MLDDGSSNHVEGEGPSTNDSQGTPSSSGGEVEGNNLAAAATSATSDYDNDNIEIKELSPVKNPYAELESSDSLTKAAK